MPLKYFILSNKGTQQLNNIFFTIPQPTYDIHLQKSASISNQSINQSINQSLTSHPSHKSLTDRPTNRLTDRPTDRLTNQHNSQPT